MLGSRSMAADPIHQPHDKLFKKTFGHPDSAAALFQAYLPESLARHLDFTAAVLEPGSFIDAEFQAAESDLLYSVPLREHTRGAFVYFLFEHQSTEDVRLAFRLLSYEVKIWQNWLQDHPALPTL